MRLYYFIIFIIFHFCHFSQGEREARNRKFEKGYACCEDTTEASIVDQHSCLIPRDFNIQYPNVIIINS